MKKRVAGLFIAFLCLMSEGYAQVADRPQLSATTQLFLQKMTNGSRPASFVYRKDNNGNTCVAGMIKVSPAVDETAFEAIGVTVGTKAGTIWTVSIPLQSVQEFLQVRGVEYIELDIPIAPDMDAARKVTKADSAQGGYPPLPMPYSGKNVVVGIIDAGFDYNHPTTKDTAGTGWRIKKVWEQKVPGSSPAAFPYGNEIVNSSVMQTIGTDLPQFSHGAHVAGIAAGSGYGSAGNSLYRGIAYESDLVFVGITPDSAQWMNTGMSDIVDGINYIFSYAASAGKPAVVNLSWGCTTGPHDGNSLFSQACDALTGKGRVFVCSGGNNGTNNVHLAKTFTSADTVIHTELLLPAGGQNTWVDMWGDTAKSFCVNVSLYNGTTQTTSSGFVCLDNTTHHFALVGSDGDTSFIDAATEASAFNQKPRILLSFHHKTADRIMLSAKGVDGSLDMWTGYVEKVTGLYGSFSSGLPNTTGGNTTMTVGDMASTRSAIAVASFASKISFTNLASGNISYASYVSVPGPIAPYSSRGPAADYRTKPDIAAPGLMVGSAVSTFDDDYKPSGASADHMVASYLNPSDGKTYYYAMLTGTSMSSPVVAGIVALMLQANRDLTPAQVLDILRSTAMHDSYTGPALPAGSNVWGYGKVNAFAALIQAIQAGRVGQLHKTAAQLSIYPNPNNGAFVLEYDTQQPGDAELVVADVAGRILSARHISMQAGKNKVPCNMQGYAPGLYFVQLASPSRGRLVTRMVIQ